MEQLQPSSNYDLTNNFMLDMFDSMIKKLPSGSLWVEVGSWYGASIKYVMQELELAGKTFDVHVVDHFKDNDGRQLDDFLWNIGKYKDQITVHHSDSVAAAELFDDDSIDFCYLDADHKYHGIKRDINAWYPKVKWEGVLAGDDYTLDYPGVVEAVNEFARDNNKSTYVHGSNWELF